MKNLTIIGLGLIGSSMARGLKGKYKITGYNRNSKTTDKALKDGVINVAAKTLADAVKDADIVVIATPPITYEEVTTAIAEHLEMGTVVTDVGSVKTHAVFSIYKHMPPGVEFVPAHPIAGSEKSGYEAGQADLFKGRKTIITALPKNKADAVERIKDLWHHLGAQTEDMTPSEHDKIYALVSHTPQLMAYAYAMAIKHKKFGADVKIEGDFATFLRISNSNADMWAEIFMLNAANISKFLEKLFNGLVHIEKFAALSEYRERLGGEEKQLKVLPTDKKQAAATAVFPSVLGGLLLFCIDEEMKAASSSRSFSSAAAGIMSSIEMIKNEIKPVQAREFVDYAGQGLKDFTSMSLYNVSDVVDNYKDEVHLLKMLIHRKIFEITAAMESGDVELLAGKLREAQA